MIKLRFALNPPRIKIMDTPDPGSDSGDLILSSMALTYGTAKKILRNN